MIYTWEKQQLSKEEIMALEIDAEKQEPHALAALGYFYCLGWHGYRKDFHRGITLINEATAKRLPQAFYVYGLLCANESLSEIYDYPKAIAFFKRSAELGFPRAMTRIGEAFLYGKGLEQSDRHAEDWLVKARCSESIPGLIFLSEKYRKKGLIDKANKLLEKTTKFSTNAN